MNEAIAVADSAQRERALDTSRSFIVQAPAGSGKTELLIQRYLALLARVDEPEEIVAITFTRKATAEMRKRVLEALAAARDELRAGADAGPIGTPQAARTLALARAVLATDAARGWALEQNASRLRLQTIDSLCTSLTRQMPMLSRFGAQPESVEDASALVREAARNTLALLESNEDAALDVARLLAHLDNHVATAEELLAGMLARRDQWLRNLHGAQDREALEAALANACRGALARLRTLLLPFPEVLAVANHAFSNLGLEPLPVLPSAEDADAWRAIAGLLLTKDGLWRRKFDVRGGFPPGKTRAEKALAADWRARALGLIERLAADDALRRELEGCRSLPPVRYDDRQWQALGAMTRLAPRATAELWSVFAKHGKCDFTEIAQAASRALGIEAPTDLALALDYRIRHLLVDEFQDTSFAQFELLEKLTAGWASGEGRTLFLVGDPMQSIYRFRQAEVGLFLKARREGIGAVELEPLALSVNFRSQADIVDWVNRAFVQVMPRGEDIAAGAVPYTPCESAQPPLEGGVTVHALFNRDEEGEAAKAVRLARAARGEGTTAILVRNRKHLERIVPRLRRSGLRFRAIEIEHLGHRQAVQDLLALSRAASHAADRAAWLALLRAPWCGLTLADLHALAAGKLDDCSVEIESRSRNAADLGIDTDTGAAARTIWELMHDPARLARLSSEGRARLERVRDILARALGGRGRGSLRVRVEAAWLALGGPACVENATDLEDAETFLDYLEESQEAGEIADGSRFETGMEKLFAMPDVGAGEGDPHIMTIHKAKGLEFDTVIVAGLGRSGRGDERKLFAWVERPAETAGRGGELLVAPISETGEESDPIYRYIGKLDEEKRAFEEGRLLYVAATRARKHLHLIGDVGAIEKEGRVVLKPPSKGSLLERLWPAVAGDFSDAAPLTPDASAEAEGAGGAATIDQALRRLPSSWAPPAPPEPARWSPPDERAPAGGEIEFSWVGEALRHVGSVVHRWLQRIAEDGLNGWNRARIASLHGQFRRQLAARGVAQNELERSVERVAAALANAIEDERGRWLLAAREGARSEQRLAALIDGRPVHLVVDRVFTDEAGRLWIVDYKTSSHEGAGREAFLERERERYAAQLERYAQALGGAGNTALGLYFPLVSGWREWQHVAPGFAIRENE